MSFPIQTIGFNQAAGLSWPVIYAKLTRVEDITENHYDRAQVTACQHRVLSRLPSLQTTKVTDRCLDNLHIYLCVCLSYAAKKCSSSLIFKCSLCEYESANCDLKCVCVCVCAGGAADSGVGGGGGVKRG